MHQRIVFVDGYNVLLKIERYARLMKSDKDAARRSFVEFLASRRKRGEEFHIVFDGYGEHIVGGGGIRVFFSLTRSADQWIAKKLEDRPNTRNVLVVSSDIEVARHARSLGAEAASSESFLAAEPPEQRARKEEKPADKEMSQAEKNMWLELFKKGGGK